MHESSSELPELLSVDEGADPRLYLHQLGGGNDELAARGKLDSDARQLATAGAVSFISGFRVEQVLDDDGEIYIVSSEGNKAGPFDQVIADTGARPNFEIARELQLDFDAGIESTTTMAPLIDPNLHSCGSVRPHGVAELVLPETGVCSSNRSAHEAASECCTPVVAGTTPATTNQTEDCGPCSSPAPSKLAESAAAGCCG